MRRLTQEGKNEISTFISELEETDLGDGVKGISLTGINKHGNTVHWNLWTVSGGMRDYVNVGEEE